VICDAGCSGDGAVPEPATTAKMRSAANEEKKAKEKKAAAEEEEERCVRLLCGFAVHRQVPSAPLGAGTVSLSVGTAHSRVMICGCSEDGAAPKAAPKTAAAKKRGSAVKKESEEEARCVSLLCGFTVPTQVSSAPL
jgi:hypothetical protein